MSDHVRAKAHRLVTDEAVRVEAMIRGYLTATVSGDTGTYAVTVSRDPSTGGVESCSCPATVAQCSHSLAVRMIAAAVRLVEAAGLTVTTRQREEDPE